MRTIRIALVAASLAAMFSASCSVFDPTHGMNEEQKQAYYAEKAAQKEQRRLAQEEFNKKNVADLNVPGEGHDEARDAQIVGRYECRMELPVGEYNFLLKKKDAIYKKHKRAQFFANGSFVEECLYDCYKATDGSATFGDEETRWHRGMWKTQGDEIHVRLLGVGGMTGWQCLGKYQIGTSGTRKLLAVGKDLQGLEALVAKRDEAGKVNDPKQLDLWFAN